MNLTRAGQSRRTSTLEYRALMSVGIVVFLVSETLSRLVPIRRAARRSIWGEACAAARRTVPLAFMG
jgi:hypothetical protein